MIKKNVIFLSCKTTIKYAKSNLKLQKQIDYIFQSSYLFTFEVYNKKINTKNSNRNIINKNITIMNNI